MRSVDLIAGLSLAGLLLPEAVAYSGIANLPPQAGIIALFAGLMVYGVLGSSRFAVVSGTSSSAAVVAATSAGLASAHPELRFTLAAAFVLLAGLVFLLAALARLGNATDFIAKPVLRGFSFGLAIVIVLKQLPLLLGLPGGHGNLLVDSWQLLRGLGSCDGITLAVGLGALGLLWVLERWRRVPAALLLIALGILLESRYPLQARGLAVVGEIRLEHLQLRWPALALPDWQRLAEVSVALALVLYSESAGSIRSLALRHGDSTSPNRDLAALGFANLLSGLAQGLPVGAGYSASSANEAAGAQSRAAGLWAALTVLLLVLTMLPRMAQTPVCILAAIVIHAVSHNLNPAVFRNYFRWQRDRVIALLAVVAVLGLGVLNGLLLAVAGSLALLLRGFAQDQLTELRRYEKGSGHDFVDASRHPGAQAVAGVLVLRPAAPVFFANADRIFAHARERLAQARVTTLVLSLEESPDIDGTTIEALSLLTSDIGRQGGRLLLARLKPPILDALARAAIPGLPAAQVTHFSVDDAVEAALRSPTAGASSGPDQPAADPAAGRSGF